MKKILFGALLAVMATGANANDQLDSLSYEIPEVQVAAKYISPVSIGGETMQMRRMPQSVSVVNPTRIKEMNRPSHAAGDGRYRDCQRQYAQSVSLTWL